MRLWHTDILPYLPRTQLLAQKRECDLIWKYTRIGKKVNHILINYIHDYDIDDFQTYYCELVHEFVKRGYKCKDKAFKRPFYLVQKPFAKHHNQEYMTICYWNLREKYLRGQKDFTKDIWHKLEQFYQNYIKEGK